MQEDASVQYSEYRQRLTNFSNEFDLGLFLHIVRKSLVWAVGFFGLAMLAAFVYLRYTPEVYQAATLIQLGEDDRSSRILNVDFSNENGLDARLELLRSKLLVARTLKRLPVDISYYGEGQILTSEHYRRSPYSVVVDQADGQWKNRPIYLTFNSTHSFGLVGTEHQNLPVGQRVQLPGLSFTLDVADPTGLEEVLEAASLYFTINTTQALVNRFHQNMAVRVMNQTAKTLEISFEDNNGILARDFVKAHAETFVDYDLQKRIQSDDNILRFIDAQIDTVYTNLSESERTLNNYKQENRINDLESVSGVYLDRLTEYEDEVIRLEVEERLLAEVEDLAGVEADSIAIYNLVPLVAGSKFESSLSGLLEELHNLLLEKENLLYSATPNNNRIRQLEYQIGVQKELVVETIGALRDKITERRAGLEDQLGDVRGVYYGLPSKELEFARLKRLFAINEKYYTMLLEKRIQYRISREGFVTNHNILEEAIYPSAPVSPRPQAVTLTFGLIGLLLGLVFISVRYLVHNDISSLNEVVRISQASISTLGIVPKYREDLPESMLIVDRNPKSVISEAFRSIRTNLQFVDNGPGTKVAAVTSTISSEGKTFVSLNLGGIVAFSGKKVLVVDLDMRKPKIHRGFKTKNNVGMSTLLIGRTTLDETVQKSQLENLDFITAGPVPPNPAELIIQPRMAELLDQFRERYDFIVIDTPPVGLVTDGVEIIQNVDYPIYVFKSDFSRKQFVQVADRLINESGISRLSVVLNNVDVSRNRYTSKYGYGYGYGYGQNYGAGYYQEDTPKKPTLLRRIFGLK